MRLLLALSLVYLLLAPACAAPAPARATHPAFKGYELYSYEVPGQTWRYVLLVGTNRIKSIDEVANATPLTLDQLKQRLATMAVGETVSWSFANVGTHKGALRLSRPEAAVVRDLQALAGKLQIHLLVP